MSKMQLIHDMNSREMGNYEQSLAEIGMSIELVFSRQVLSVGVALPALQTFFLHRQHSIDKGEGIALLAGVFALANANK